ncbi:MAG: hypothetical protein JXB04_06005 [Kiritimatiellae bacterium]|nr:hypothetical protein [Kiritimatiellia bacterium]
MKAQEPALKEDKIVMTNRAARHALAEVVRRVNLLLLAAFAAWFFLAPAILVVWSLRDPAWRGPGIPSLAWRVHRRLAPRYAKWARARIASGQAAHLLLHDVPSTEWPMFGSVYYLWATEALQDAWEQDPSLAPQAPNVYAREAIEACKDLVLDPVHHTWVKTHWGPDYLHRRNVFFRSLIIAALTSRENLLGGGKHLDILRDQVETLAAELDASPRGVLEDYPGECYPIDVFAAVALIRRADRVLGTDHSAFAARAIRGFEGAMLDYRGLFPYEVDWETGIQYDSSRGVGNSYVLIFAPELYPDRAQDWYERYEKYFWQERLLAAGFREYPNDLPGRDWTYDVDAGPIIAGFSPAANAFGVAAAKINGRLDHAFTLASQVLVASWPLPNGRLLGGRFLSSPGHAPYLGEACLLFFMTRTPAAGVEIRTGGRMPGFVYASLAFYLLAAALFLVAAWRGWTHWRRGRGAIAVPAMKTQFTVWLALVVAGLVLIAAGKTGLGLIVAGLGQYLPHTRPRADM